MARRTIACLLAAALQAARTTTCDAASVSEAPGAALLDQTAPSPPAAAAAQTAGRLDGVVRGTRARIGFLTNPPRTFGVTTRVGV